MNIKEIKEYAKEVKDKVNRHIEKAREFEEEYFNLMNEISELEGLDIKFGKEEKISIDLGWEICDALELEDSHKGMNKLAKADLIEGVRTTARFGKSGMHMDWP